MIGNLLETKTMQILEKALDATSQRHNVISNNIANVDTPGFKRTDVLFEDQLKKALNTDSIEGNRTDSRHISIGKQDLGEIKPNMVTDESTSYRIDGNNVDIDNEMAKLAKNQLMYDALAQKISSEFSKMRYVISDGRR